MKYFKLSLLILTSVFFISACNQLPSDEVTYRTNPNNYVIDDSIGIYDEDDVRWARENLDLRAVGELLEDADSAEEFEYLLNSRNGVDNLDLNGDGYADYISVREYDDRYDYQRGFTLYTMYGTDLIQEIATIIFDRHGYRDYDYPGARVLICGNDEIYGDNFYYETDWRYHSYPIVSWVFDDRDYYYHSPYYYGYYPTWYETYAVVETPIYVTRIQEYYPNPVFVQTYQPTVTEIQIASPYREKTVDQVYARMAKPTHQQVEFQREDPKFAEFVKDRQTRIGKVLDDSYNGGRRDNQVERAERVDQRSERVDQRAEKFGNDQSQMRDRADKSERGNGNQWKAERQNQPKFERQDQPKFERQNQPRAERQNKPERQNQVRFERQNQPKFERQNQPRVERQSQPKFERQNQPRVERQNQPRVERQNQPRMERPSKQSQPQVRVQPKGGGNPHGGGGAKQQGNPNGGGKPAGGGGGGGKGKIKP